MNHHTRIYGVQIHRFGDDVAIYLGGETQYLSQDKAQALVNAVNAVITDIAERSFAASKVGTYSFECRTDRFKTL